MRFQIFINLFFLSFHETVKETHYGKFLYDLFFLETEVEGTPVER